MTFVIYNNENEIGKVITNHSITKDEACILLGMEELDPKSFDDPNYSYKGSYYWYDDIKVVLE